MRPHSIKESEIVKKWHVVDASGQTVGRLAASIAHLLRGKHKPQFTPHLDCGDNVVVINADKVVLTGRKWEQKNYYRHSNYIGGIKWVGAQKLLETHPTRILESAVRGMLPKNTLGRKILKNLRIYAGNQHPHEGQQPSPLSLA